MSERLPVARIGKPRGVRGQLWVEPYRPDLEALLGGGKARVWLTAPGRCEAYGVATFFRYPKGSVLGLEGVGSFEAAEALRGCELELPADLLPPDPPGAFDALEVVGWEVVDATRGLLGTVAGAREGGEYWVLDVETPSGAAEIPAVEGLGVEVDREARRFRVALPPGWPGVDAGGGAP